MVAEDEVPEAVEETLDLPVIRTVRHKSSAAALLTIGCKLAGVVVAEGDWCDVEIEVPHALKSEAQRLLGDGAGITIEWDVYREHLREISKLIKEQRSGGSRNDG